MKKVSTVGVGETKFGKHEDKGACDLGAEAVLEAMKDAEISQNDIQVAYIGHYGLTGSQKASVGNIILKKCGITGIPITRVENICSSGASAIREAYFAIAGGFYDVAIVVGVEEMTRASTAEMMEALMSSADMEAEGMMGLTWPGWAAMRMKCYMKKYGATREQIAKIPVKSHKNAYLNPDAHFHKTISIDDVLKSRMIADPVRLYDCCPASDGAAAAILVNKDLARKFSATPVDIAASVQTSGIYGSNLDFTEEPSLIKAAREAYKKAHLHPDDIDLAEIHDCFSIMELTRLEDLGFCRKGEGPKLVDEGQTEIGGKIPIGPSGGLKAKGHPVGATGVGQVVEIVKQLRGEAEKRQVCGAEVGLAHCAGGAMLGDSTVHVIHIFRV